MNQSSLGFLLEEELKREAGVVESPFRASRLLVLRIVLGLCLAGLIVRIFWLQVVHGEKNRVLSEENRILARSVQAPRGVIYDRQGVILAQNVPEYQKLRDECIDKELIYKSTGEDSAEDCPAYHEISREDALKLEAEGNSDWVRTLVGRSYCHGPEAAHLVGYVGEADREDLQENPEYLLGDLVGKYGIESYYEDLLHGKAGAELVEINANGQVEREVASIEPISGKDISLSVDMRLQKKAFELMGENEGALVALDPNNGEILTMVSVPSFDPNDVVSSLEREDQPFFNRAIGGLYPPGSVFKIVTAAAALEEGKIDEYTQFEDTGEIRIGDYRYGNWYFDQYGRTEGLINIVDAIKRSNDIFFYKAGEALGATNLSNWAKAFGLGRKTNIDLFGEAEGVVPSPLWKERYKGERWFLGNTYHFAIGQSDLTATPLQIALMTGAEATNKICRPRILLSETELVPLLSPLANEGNCESLDLSEKTRGLVRQGMTAACSSGGTAFPFFDFSVGREGVRQRMEVACKTGTSEFGDPEDRTHAWFTVFAPIEKPEIVVTVLLEKAGEGSYEAAPVAKEFLEYYFEEVSGK